MREANEGSFGENSNIFYDELGVVLEQISTSLSLQLDFAHQQLNETHHNALTEQYTVVGICVALAFALSVLIVLTIRSFTTPLGKLMDGVQAITDGKFDKRVEVKGSDEFFVLSNAMNKMSDDLNQAFEKIKEQNESLERTVKKRTEQLRQKNNDITAMMNNVPLGVFTIGQDLMIHSEYSRHLETILETTNIPEQSIMNLLFENSTMDRDQLEINKTTLDFSIGENEYTYEVNSTSLDKSLIWVSPETENRKHLEIDWAPILTEGNADKLLVCLRDTTELLALKEANAQKESELKDISELLAIDNISFYDHVDLIYELNRVIDKELRAGAKDIDSAAVIRRQLHTAKGNARALGLSRIPAEVHEIETYMDAILPPGGQDAISKANASKSTYIKLKVLLEIIDSYTHTYEQKLGRARDHGDENGMKYQQVVTDCLALVEGVGNDNLLVSQLREKLQSVAFDSIEWALSHQIHSLEQTSRELGKSLPKIRIIDKGYRFESKLIGKWQGIFGHLITNALVHGIEKPADRTKSGKQEAGQISIEVTNNSSDFVKIQFFDDGRGINPGLIRAKLKEKGQTALAIGSDHEVIQSIFNLGLSTEDKAGELAGRGAGLNAVKADIESMGGEITVNFTSEKADADGFLPFTFTIEIRSQQNIKRAA